MNPPLFYEPVLRLSTAPEWTRALALRFRRGLGGRGHLVVDEPGTLAAELPSLAVTRPHPGLWGWATPATWGSFRGPLELEAPFPLRAEDGERLAFWLRHSRVECLRLNRPAEASLAALDAALQWVPDADLPVSLDLESFGQPAAFWLLTRRPGWSLYGPGELFPALAVARTLDRELRLRDRSGAPPLPTKAPPDPACPNPPGPDPRHPPVPATWL